MRRYVLSEDMIIQESQRVTAMHPLFDAVEKNRKLSLKWGHLSFAPIIRFKTRGSLIIVVKNGEV